MSRLLTTLTLIVVLTEQASAADVDAIQKLLDETVLEPGTSLREVQEFTETRVPRVPDVKSANEWTTLSNELRARTLNEVVLRGDAEAWAKAPTEAEWLETIDGGAEYRIRKLRFEAVPGMWIPALLYEPKKLTGKSPVFLNVNGHDGKGKVADYKQARCINLAKRGIIALNLEWVGMGQLRTEDFVHYRMNQLDLCGTAGIAPFYLSMKRGLDILLSHENADPDRVGVAGLSGGGWQTIFISGLDDRVTLSNPVAGYSSFRTRAYVQSDLGDSEQTPSDLATVVDYTHLTAMRAPHPTLLTNNDRDRCCFAAGNALPLLLESSRPKYRLYGQYDNLWAHINHLPGSHNFQQDNREALYRFIGAKWFSDNDKFNTREIDCSAELKTADELHVPIAENNAGFNTIAMGLMKPLPHNQPIKENIPSVATGRVRRGLAKIVRSQGNDLRAVPSAKIEGNRNVTFRIGDEWTVPATVITPENQNRTVILVSDGGRRTAAKVIAKLLDDGAQVVAVDPFYFGESKIPTRDFLYGLLVAAVGERPLGIQVDQLRSISKAIAEDHITQSVELYALGRRTGLGALIASALEPETIAQVTVVGGFESLKQIIEENLRVSEAPELFCFGLLKEFDIPQIEALVTGNVVQDRSGSTEPTPAK